uniref:RRN3 homolog, RNA polymerase I transcription factor n=1 Tax=Crocodylus porosus TaxID=8502 RepID=A0A7M4E8J0_CROPO
MAMEGGAFFGSPLRKTVRFGGTLRDVLLKHEQGETADFELLKHQLSDPDIKDAQIINWLHEFRASVVHLTKDVEELVSILLKLPWLRRSQDVVEEYLDFLGNLVSAQSIYLRPCLRMIVSHFVPTQVIVREDGVDFSDSDDDEENLSGNFKACHRALQTVARYVPLTPLFLLPILVENFPFINKSESTLEYYVHNLLRITVYLPTLRLGILELIVEKLLKLDVSTPRQDIEDAEENANAPGSVEKTTEEGLFDMEEDEETEKENQGASSESDVMAHPLAERLDILMTILFTYIKEICYVNGTLDISNTKGLYRDLITIFDKLILPTHALCHVQYFMFYICSFKLGFAEAFLDHLWKILQDPNNPAVIRQTAGNYIGSFLARATFIPTVTVKACLDLLVNWLHRYIDSQDAGTNAYCDVALHGPFYSTCQAVFYTFIFRHRQLLDGNLRKGLAYLQNLNFERIVMCQLNPLKICLVSVVNLFAAITRSKKNIDPLYQIWEELSAEDLQDLTKPIKKASRSALLTECQPVPLATLGPVDLQHCLNSDLPQVLLALWIWPGAGNTTEDEDDDFLKGETPQNDGMLGITPSSYDSNILSPPSSLGTPPPGTYVQQHL